MNLQQPTTSAPPTYDLTRDPLFYIIAGFFAVLTTALPAAIGQPRFLPILQAVALTIFVAMPVRRRKVHFAFYVMALWIILELVTFVAVALLFPNSAERAINGGFAYRSALLTWLYAGEPLPNSFVTAPASRLLELAGVILGSLFTAGLVGSWFLVRAVNLAGYAIATVGSSLGSALGWALAIPLWYAAWIAGLACLVILCAEPLLTSNWSLNFYWTQRRRLLVASAALLALGLLLELVLAPGWPRLAS